MKKIINSWLEKGYAFFIITPLLLVGIAFVFWQNYLENQQVNQNVALEDAKNFAVSVVKYRNFYAKQILPGLVKRGVPITHDFKQHPDGAAPLPATFAKEFGRYLSAGRDGYKVKLFSDQPFDWSPDSHQLDAFEADAMAFLREHPQESFWRIETLGGQAILRFARADVLQEGCVACHNTYPGTPKTDWKTGDVRGVLEVQRPLSYAYADQQQTLNSFLLMVALALITLMLLAVMMRRLKGALQRTRQLLKEQSSANARLSKEAQYREQLTSELVMNQNKMRAVMNSVTDVIVVIDAKGIVIEVNHAIEALFGYHMDELLGENIKMLMPEPYRNAHDGYLDHYMHTRQKSVIGRTRRVEGLRKNGERFPIDLSVSEVQLNDSLVFTGVIRDITEQVKMEDTMAKARDEAIQSAQLKSEFLANMSHEIRTPMNGVIGMTNLLLDSPLTQEQRSMAETVSSSAAALLQIINDILDFSKIEAGKLTIQTESIFLLDWLDSVVKVVADLAFAKGLRFDSILDVDLPSELTLDPGRTRQVLVNLLGNAIKFTESGYVLLVVKLDAKAAQPGLIFEVQDTGIGISADAQQKLFKAFSQVDGTSTRLHGGTGLGLVISQQLVELMGGHLAFHSVQGQGSQFSFRIPVSVLSDTPCLVPRTEPKAALYLAPAIPPIERWCQQMADLNVALVPLADWSQFQQSVQQPSYDRLLVDLVHLETIQPDPAALLSAMQWLSEQSVPVIWLVTRHQLQVSEYRPFFEPASAVCLAKPVHPLSFLAALDSSDDGLGDDSLSGEPVTVKAPEADAASTPPDPAVASNPPETKSAARILLVEDNLVNQKLALALLAKMGYQAELASNGQEALDKVVAGGYDLILMDCQMPVKDGYQATRDIRAHEQTLGRHVPIVAMTANAMKGDDEKCFAAGMDDYMSKPINPALLAEKVTFYLDASDDPI
ncbi:MAG: PAS domain S-box protein [Hydrogenovibrio sp.]